MLMPLPSTLPENPHLAAYRAELDALALEGGLRRCRVINPDPSDSLQPMRIIVEGRPAVNFSGNDYLGLSADSGLREAAVEAVRRYGVGSASSRLISGTGPLAVALEQAVAGFKQAEAALVFNSGYQANVAILQALLGPGDWVFCDRLNHASLVDGCRLSGARWKRYRHLDFAHLERLLAQSPPGARKWIVTDSVFSMDGDYPDLSALATLAEHASALVLVDEAHATGLYGAVRRSGLCEQLGVSGRIALQMGTFSKALGGSGAYVAGSAVLIDTLINRARGFIYSTAPAPPVLAAALRAVEQVQANPAPTRRLWKNIAFLESLLLESGLSKPDPCSDTPFHCVNLPLESPIIPLVVGDSADALALSHALLEAGHFVQAIRPPTVPPGTARLRLSLSAAHTREQIRALVESLAALLPRSVRTREPGE
jgi:8-amino-7-oxononanoate synthase